MPGIDQKTVKSAVTTWDCILREGLSVPEASCRSLMWVMFPSYVRELGFARLNY